MIFSPKFRAPETQTQKALPVRCTVLERKHRVRFTVHWSSPSCSLLEWGENPMVKIHGNYCGPNWTGGKALPANDPRVDWSVMPTDSLDRACMNHDLSCSKGGCTAADDRRLARKATMIGIFNPRLAPIARAVAIAMWTASLSRRNWNGNCNINIRRIRGTEITDIVRAWKRRCNSCSKKFTR